MPLSAAFTVVKVDYANPTHAQALVTLLDAYARDPAGGGEPLSDFTKANLVRELAARPQAFSVLAFDGADVESASPVGLVNCIEGFSTFACRPLVNVHDVVVAASHRGRGVAAQMLAEVERIARGRGACKLTLEVLSGNDGARRLYERVGFAGYQLDPAMGQAQFLQKWLA
ncbi:GNAT family N-acetyltransferase [Rhodoferax sediminis]|jgi:ribosomal protein S18 acetylase RimI-like enzyme|uniref:GNAT family N-acetyltransferase n=1 Tax=Rhodoferax sediminis TaxID=2509614 RepID=A0A515DAM2_9BURK|nr:GNAT family N-acetyltransferase [Rhodoferax sediminis]QDL37461.1 GNAT family N-acetyltransferase [Rhodoferax sediminis]